MISVKFRVFEIAFEERVRFSIVVIVRLLGMTLSNCPLLYKLCSYECLKMNATLKTCSTRLHNLNTLRFRMRVGLECFLIRLDSLIRLKEISEQCTDSRWLSFLALFLQRYKSFFLKTVIFLRHRFTTVFYSSYEMCV